MEDKEKRKFDFGPLGMVNPEGPLGKAEMRGGGSGGAVSSDKPGAESSTPPPPPNFEDGPPELDRIHQDVSENYEAPVVKGNYTAEDDAPKD